MKMRQFVAILFAIVLVGCNSAPPDIPWEPVPPAPPVEPPAPPQPPPVEPHPPASLEEILEALVVGLAPHEVEAIVGSQPISIPDDPRDGWQVRWHLNIDGEEYALIVYFTPQNTLSQRVLVPISEAP